MEGITHIASYNPEYVSMDYACQYLRAMENSNISAYPYNAAQGRSRHHPLTGSTDMPTRFYLFTESGGTIQQTFVTVPQFSGPTQVVYVIP